MRILGVIMVFLFSFCAFAHASVAEYYKARELAMEQAQESAPAQATESQENKAWTMEADIRAGAAQYKEKESTISSSFNAFYPELFLTAAHEGENGLQTALGFSFGGTTTDTEKWFINGVEYQTNDLYFYRINAKASIGKILYSENKDFKAVPFLAYGFRFIDFNRTNFNILNIITSRDIVTEKYYIQHIDFGVNFDKKFNDKFSVSGLASYGYVFYNQAHNSALGDINGSGGYLAEVNVNLGYSLNKSWQLIFGGFGEWQKLKGGEKDNVLWPDNRLDIYGGNIGAKYSF